MVFDFSEESGLTGLENWLQTRSYIEGYNASQADVSVHKAIEKFKNFSKYPHIQRWSNHIATHDHGSLPGDASKDHTSYGPDASEPKAEAIQPQAKEVKKYGAADDDDDIDLFGSDSEEEDAATVAARQERLDAYNAKKAAKPKLAAKSVVTLDVKPWDDETDMKALEKSVRGIEKDGLTWGASKLIDLAYGIKKLQINLVVEDEKVSTADLQEEIEGFEDYVQSTDIAAMQKL